MDVMLDILRQEMSQNQVISEVTLKMFDSITREQQYLRERKQSIIFDMHYDRIIQCVVAGEIYTG